jgi:putative transposase
VVSRAVSLLPGVTGDGRREVLGFEVGDSEDGALGPRFCARCEPADWPGLAGHLRRPPRPQIAVGAVPRASASISSKSSSASCLSPTAAIRTIFGQPDAQHVREQFETIAVMLRHPKSSS